MPHAVQSTLNYCLINISFTVEKNNTGERGSVHPCNFWVLPCVFPFNCHIPWVLGREAGKEMKMEGAFKEALLPHPQPHSPDIPFCELHPEINWNE